MKTIVISLSMLVAACAVSAQQWESLFDGQSLAGWKASEQPGSFKVLDGQLVCDGPRSHLFYVGKDGSAEFQDFELSADVKAVPGANSGVYFHTRFQPEGFPKEGFEIQVHNARTGAGDYRENKLTGSLYGIRNVYKPMVRDGEWFNLRALVQGKQVRIWVNETLVVDYFEPEAGLSAPVSRPRKLGRGTFALQCHDPSSKVFYRNLRVKRLEPSLQRAGAPAPTPYDLEVRRLGAANYPVVNYHVHLKGGLTLEQALAESRRSGVFYGIAVNCGLNFSVTNDAGIDAYLKSMQGVPAFVAMQAEGREWVNLFSKAAVSRFDYVFTDAMTIVDDNGRRMRLWMANEVPEIKDPEAFMDMLVDRTVKILSNEPIQVLVNPTFLPAPLAPDYERLWTPARMNRVIAAAVQHGVAIEINSRYRLPSQEFIKLAKTAGAKFTFGTNNADRDIGQLDYSFEMVKAAGLKWQDIWVPPLRAAAR